MNSIQLYFSPYGSGIPGFERILAHLTDSTLLFIIGDFIYVDLFYRFAPVLESYYTLYRHVLGHPVASALFSKVSSMFIFDDHEIENDWVGGTSGIYTEARNAFDTYLGSTNTVRPRKESWFEGLYGATPYFVMDTRSFRTPPHHPNIHPSMLDTSQKEAIVRFLKTYQNATAYPFKLLFSPSPVTFNWESADTWSAYPHDRHWLLDQIRSLGLPGVVILSGDRHQVGLTEFIYKGTQPLIHSRGVQELLAGETIVAIEMSVSPINNFNLPLRTFWTHYNTNTSHDWVRDQTVWYSSSVGRFSVGRVRIDPKKRLLTLCVYGEKDAQDLDPKESNDCNQATVDPTGGHLVYQYTIKA